MILHAFISGGNREVQPNSDFQRLPSHYFLKKLGSQAVSCSHPKFTGRFWKWRKVTGLKINAISFLFLQIFKQAAIPHFKHPRMQPVTITFNINYDPRKRLTLFLHSNPQYFFLFSELSSKRYFSYNRHGIPSVLFVHLKNPSLNPRKQDLHKPTHSRVFPHRELLEKKTWEEATTTVMARKAS